MHSGHCGEGCVSGDILCRYELSRGDLFALSCANVRLVLCGSDISVELMAGGCIFNILLCVLKAYS